MPKILKLYYIFLTNAGWFFLFLFIFHFNDYAQSQITTNSIKTIVIDPGHGGKDPGTMGTKRYSKYEKDIALSVSLKLGYYISNEYPEINVVYTRNTDVFLELKQRTQIANDVNSDLFISIHCDGFTNSSASGASVFVMGMSKLKANLDVAMRENSAIYLEDNYQMKYDGFNPESPESYIVFNLMQNTYLDQSLQLAEEVEKQFTINTNRKSRGVKQAPFYVISRTNMPSILVECGFLTNHKEEDFLHSDTGQEYIATAIFKAFKDYKHSVEDIDESELTDKKSKSDEKKDINSKVTSNADNEKVVFRVQIGTYLRSMKNVKSFIDIQPIELEIDGMFKYYVGETNNKAIASKIKKKMLNYGYNDAFIVAFYKNKRISMSEALVLQKKKINYE